ncbi:MAG: hypothetical protein GX564_10760 [Oligosphaeraceae bacterium]|nr:hypothetical protein [Oligosphaeraceae bacterium]
MQNIIRLILVVVVCSTGVLMGQDREPNALRQQAAQLHRQENYAEAEKIYRQLLELPLQVSGPEAQSGDFLQAASCLQVLNQPAAREELLERMIQKAEHSWRLKWRLAEYILGQYDWGYLLDGKFTHGWSQNRGQRLRVGESDRRRALQLFHQAMLLLRENPAEDPQARADFYCAFALAFLGKAGIGLADDCPFGLASAVWRLQNLSDLNSVPAWDSAENEEVEIAGAPVGDDGQPVFFALPAAFTQAANDGERCRWLLQQAAECTPRGYCQAKFILANYSCSLYGTQTLQDYFHLFTRASEEGQERTSALLALQTLEDDETVARLANGIRRFRLPPDYNFLALYAEVLERSQSVKGWQKERQAQILRRLAEIQENRHQPARALLWWQRLAQLQPEEGQRQAEKITGHWATFLPSRMQVFGEDIAVELRFRNATAADFQLFRLNLPGIIDEVEARILAGEEKNLNYHFANLGAWLLEKGNEKFIGAKVREWSEALTPAANYRDKVVKVSVPLPAPGAYWLVCHLPGGNISRIPVLAQKHLLFSKNLQQETLWQLCQARNGAPAANAGLQILAWNVRWDQQRRKSALVQQRYNLTTDENGSAFLQLPQDGQRYGSWRCLVRAQLPDEFLCADLSTVSFRAVSSDPQPESKAFLLTDRPVYRPGQLVQYAAWLQEATYSDRVNPWVGQPAALWLQAPGEKARALSDAAEPDKGLPKLFYSAHGGVSGEYRLPAEARLGVYSLLLSTPAPGKGSRRAYQGSLQFRVEEYRKPEYEVIVGIPEGTVMLGESFTVPVTARYYFGAPVTRARARIKVLRQDYQADFWPTRPWDWLYGPGYWWLWDSPAGMPGREAWDSLRPRGFWLPPRPLPPPEVVVQMEQDLDEEGQVKLTIDTDTARQLYGDRDHRYEIIAEVRDLSRRTIVGRGQVLVGRKQFRLQAWTNAGHFRAGDTVTAYAQASTLSGQPLAGPGTLQLLQLRYDQQPQPQETALQQWDLQFDEHGRAEQRLQISQPGQYRLAWKMQPVGQSQEAPAGACLLSVYGSREDASGDYRYDVLEAVPDQPEYAPGEMARLRLNTARPDSLVLLFLRPRDGVCARPQFLRLKGNSREISIPISPEDRPNFFIEALLVSDGAVHSVLRSLAVPPASRILNVELLPSANRLLPGGEVAVELRLTDAAGQPFAGELAISVYDKSLEYISGGSNIPPIKPYFWSWRRNHHSSFSTMSWYLNNSLWEQEKDLESIGIFDRELLQQDDLRSPGLVFSPLDAGGMKMRQSMAAGAPMAVARFASVQENASAQDGAAQPMAMPLLRQNFADTAYWSAGVLTDGDGWARVAFPLPDSLTTWKLRVWAMGPQGQAGEGEAELITAKNVLVRLQAPRFLLEQDEVVLGAMVHNYFSEEIITQVSLQLEEGGSLELLPGSPVRQTVPVPAAGQQRVDWRVRAVRAGEASIRIQALSDAESDALEQRLPVNVHGQDILLSHSGVINPAAQQAEASFVLPSEIRAGSARLEIACSPSLALAMLDAIPYLVNYPYACTEQTLNRFLPAVLTLRTLQRLDLPLADLARKSSNLDTQELGSPAERARQWQRYQDLEPVVQEETRQKMIREGLESLLQMQCQDGGWGWFSGWGEKSSPYFTALVVHGLLLGRQCQLSVPPDALQRGLAWLQGYQQETLRCLQLPPGQPQRKEHADDLDALVFQVLAETREEQYYQEAMAELLFRDKQHLRPYSKALFALAEWERLQLPGTSGSSVPQALRLQELVRNLHQFVQRDSENQTAWLNLGPGNFWWCWYGDEIETQAAFLKLLCRTGEEQGELSRGLVKYLLHNRKHGNYWRSTRNTAAVLEAFSVFLEASGEGRSELEVELLLNGRTLAQERYSPRNIFSAKNRFVVPAEDLPPGEQVLTIRKNGPGPLYFNAYLQYFSQQDFIPAAGLEVKVQRHIYRLIREDEQSSTPAAGGRAQSVRRERYRRELLPTRAVVQSGELLEVEMLLESKNDYEYMLLEDYKAASCEAVEMRSGYGGNSLNAYQEFRDDRVAMFIPLLPRGKHSLSYRLRVESSGEFSALPTKLTGLYAPELQGNAEEQKLDVRAE